MSDYADVDGLVDSIDEFKGEAMDAFAQANPGEDFDDPSEVYEMLSPMDDSRTYDVELTLDEYELVQLNGILMEPMQRVASADEILVSASILQQLVSETPEHFERLDAYGESVADEPRGFQ